MSSPVHHSNELDTALMYAPPWARRAGVALSGTAATRPRAGALADADEEAAVPSFIGDRAMLALRRRLSLEPEIVPPPPVEPGAGMARRAFGLFAACAVAALGAWGIMSFVNLHSAEKGRLHSRVTLSVARPVKVIAVHAPMKAPPVQIATATDLARPAASGAADASGARTDRLSAVQKKADPTPSVEPTLALAPDEIAMLIKRSREHLMNGDIASARLLLRRAAEAGNAEAALALGSTFDPIVVARLGAVGVQSDAAKARTWYQKAAQLGSSVASQQLAKLAGANP